MEIITALFSGIATGYIIRYYRELEKRNNDIY
jgi:hypothetical protein